jgi:hypothetical protein
MNAVKKVRLITVVFLTIEPRALLCGSSKEVLKNIRAPQTRTFVHYTKSLPPFSQLSPINQFFQLNIPINMRFSAILVTLGASIAAAAPSTPEKRQFEGLSGGGGGGFSLCTTAFQTAQCCDINIEGILNLNCHACMYSISIFSQISICTISEASGLTIDTAAHGLHNTEEFVASCHHKGQKAYCCAVSLVSNTLMSTHDIKSDVNV